MGDLGETAAGVAGIGCFTITQAIGCLAQIGAAALGLIIVMAAFNACVGG